MAFGETRIRTGVPGIDHLTEGGFERNSSVLVMGGGGCGKSIFATQFLVEGAKSNETGIYISFEERKERFFKHMSRFNWNLNKLEEQGRFIFLRYSPERIAKIVKERSKEIENAIKAVEAKRIVIDSLSAYVALFDSEAERRQMLVALFEMIEDWDCTAVVVAEEDQNPEEHHSTTMGFMADAIMLFYNEREPKGLRFRALEIYKMRGTRHESKICSMKIGSEGMVVYPDTVVL
ncbi:MAG TPA: ATPase domain-containing protein [Candidatus Nanoarchaeia archaeon]|nr:ATPase domain-containing protein [Candidatus Nanoarchaeia archaeon]